MPWGVHIASNQPGCVAVSHARRGRRAGTAQSQPPALLALPGNATALAIGDLDGDGRDDLAARMVLSRTDHVPATAIGIVLQLPGGRLAPALSLAPRTGVNAALLQIVDYDRDGVRDLVEFFTPFSDDYSAGLATLLQSQAAGSFTVATSSLSAVRGVDGGVFADLDHDGRIDFATVGFYPVGTPSRVLSTLNLLRQDGRGGFALAASIAMPISASRLHAADVDGDGRNDLVVLGDRNQAFVMAQSPGAPGTFLAPRFLP